MLHLPIGFTQEAQGRPVAWPLLVYMHGTGGGTFFAHSKKSLQSEGLQFAARNFVVASPVCEWTWQQSPSPWVEDLVRTLRAAEWVDHQRVYLTGCSMGGMGA